MCRADADERRRRRGRWPSGAQPPRFPSGRDQNASRGRRPPLAAPCPSPRSGFGGASGAAEAPDRYPRDDPFETTGGCGGRARPTISNPRQLDPRGGPTGPSSLAIHARARVNPLNERGPLRWVEQGERTVIADAAFALVRRDQSKEVALGVRRGDLQLLHRPAGHGGIEPAKVSGGGFGPSDRPRLQRFDLRFISARPIVRPARTSRRALSRPTRKASR